MALIYWIVGSFTFFITVVAWIILTPAIDTVYDAMNTSLYNTMAAENVTLYEEMMNSMSFIHSAWLYAIIILIITIIIIIYLASTQREPLSEIRRL